MKIKVITDGTAEGTLVLDMTTGAVIEDVIFLRVEPAGPIKEEDTCFPFSSPAA